MKNQKLPFILSYFFYWAAVATFLPYMSAFFESRNLAGGQIGLLISIPHFVNLISAFSFGYLSDIYKKPLIILRLCSFLFIIATLFLSSAVNFVTISICFLLFAISTAPINPIIDDMTLGFIQDPNLYGKIRIGGSFGWGITILLVGLFLSDWNYSLKFILGICLMSIFLLITFLLPNEPISQKEEKANIHKVLSFILRKDVILFFIASMIWSASEACITGYLFLHIKSLGGDSRILGISMALAILSEIIGFNYINKIMHRYKLSTLVIVAFILQFIRLLFLSIINNYVWIPPFQIFGGISFALIWASTVAFVNLNSAKEIGKSAQAIKTGLSSLGSGLGVIIGGSLYENYNTRTLYFIFAIGILIALGISLSMIWIKIRKTQN